MMRSGVSSAAARAVGYVIAGACVALFIYMLTIVLLAAASSSDGAIWLWAAAWAGIPLIATVGLTVYVWRSPHAGGYALVGVASLISSFFCLMALFPFVAI